jgi:hypothetical protein
MKLIPFVQNPAEGSEFEKVQTLEQLYSAADATRRKFEPDWYSNCLFLAGNQWEAAASDVRRFRKIAVQPPQSKVKIVSNQIFPLARQAASALRENLAQQTAAASTSDSRDVEAAELATDFLQSRFYEDREQEVRFHEILWTMCVGRVLRKTYWDPQADGLGLGGKLKGAGDIVSRTLNPFRFHVCPWSDSSEEMPWIIESDVRDVDEINDLYPGSDVQAEEYADATRLLDKLLVNIIDGSSQSAEKRRDAAILKRLYARPNLRYPRGRMFVWANGKLLQEADLPDGEMPFTALDWFPIPGRAYPLPFVTPLRDLQREINVTLSQLIELKNRQLRGDVAVRGMGDITQEINPETGQKIVRMPASVQDYQFIKYDLNTSDAEVLLSKLWNDCMQSAGIHESALGASPAGKVTATQVTLLKESDMTGLTLFRAGFDLAYAKVSRQKLLLARNHYHVPRMIRVVGESNTVRTAAFFGSDLRDTEDVRPRAVPIFTQAQIAAAKSQAAEQGLYGPYAGPTDMLAKVTALLNSGIPGIQEEVDMLLAPMTVEELRRVCAEINRLQAAATVADLRNQVSQMV